MEGRRDGIEVVEPDLPIIDTHHHVYIRPGTHYMLEDYLADAGRGHNIVASVYVETRFMSRVAGPQALRPLGEVEFANGIGAMGASGFFGPCKVAAAIVGHADMTLGDSVAEFLDLSLQTAPDRFRGVRQITMSHPDPAVFGHLASPPPQNVLEHPAFHDGFRHLGARNLSFDAAVFHNQLPAVGALADRYPHTIIILDHLGMALCRSRSAEDRAAVFKDWRAKLFELALRPNVRCKIGGLGGPYWGFGFDLRQSPASCHELAAAWTPYVQTAISAFGVERCMMESNYPPDRRSCDFVTLWNALKRTVQGCSADERYALFFGTAKSVYRIRLL